MGIIRNLEMIYNEDHNQSTPLPVIFIYLLLFSSFFIYIPVSLFRTPMFLVIQDVFLILALLLTLMHKKAIKRIFGSRISLLLPIVLYILAIVVRIIMDISSFDMMMLIKIRNLSFGIGVFVISSIWMHTQSRIDMFIRIYLFCSIIVVIYGLRQIIFGFMPFELDRLSIMGSSLGEMETLGRIRITSSFGDPLSFSFFLMVGIIIYFIARSRNLIPLITRKMHPFFLILLFITILLTLTRAPLIGMICGAVMYFVLNFKATKTQLISYVSILIFIGICIFGLNFIVNSEYLSNTSNSGVVVIRNGLESLWSLFQFSLGDEVDDKIYFLVKQSQDSRFVSWKEGLTYLISNPFGGGFIDRSYFTFSLEDVGILSIGLQIGIFGLMGILFLFMLIGIQTWVDIRRISKSFYKRQGYLLLSAWLSIFVTGGITLILETSIIATVIWTFAGILINQKHICMSRLKHYRSGSSEDLMERGGQLFDG